MEKLAQMSELEGIEHIVSNKNYLIEETKKIKEEL